MAAKKDVTPTASYKVGTLCVRLLFSARFNTSIVKGQAEKEFLYLDIFAVRGPSKAQEKIKSGERKEKRKRERKESEKKRTKGEGKGNKGKEEKKKGKGKRKGKKDPLPDLDYFCIIFCTSLSYN